MIKGLNDINVKTEEGRVLIATLSRLSGTSGYSHREPDDILQECVELANDLYKWRSK